MSPGTPRGGAAHLSTTPVCARKSVHWVGEYGCKSLERGGASPGGDMYAQVARSAGGGNHRPAWLRR